MLPCKAHIVSFICQTSPSTHPLQLLSRKLDSSFIPFFLDFLSLSLHNWYALIKFWTTESARERERERESFVCFKELQIRWEWMGRWRVMIIGERRENFHHRVWKMSVWLHYWSVKSMDWHALLLYLLLFLNFVPLSLFHRSYLLPV